MSKNFSTVELPNNIEMEKEILSSLLLKEGVAIPAVAKILSVDDFYRPEHKIIYRTILQLYAQGTPPNILSIIEELKKSDELNKIGYQYIFALDDIAVTTAYSESHAKIVKDKARLRRLFEIGEKIIDDTQKGIKSAEEILDDIEKIFSTFSRDEQTKSKKISPYFANSLTFEIECLKNYANRKTDFENIDKQQFFSPGLYVIGATPAAGKTTFCWQLLEQLATNGESCIFCSYEMSSLELFTKTAARHLFISNKQTSLTAADIRRGAKSMQLENVISEVADTQLDLQVFELQDESVDDLLTLLKPLCTDKENAPIICIDYLQIIPHGKDNIKSGIDDTVRKLKKFQRDTNTTFIVISSFNRGSYTQSVSFESFKESGNIEYTADVVWGLQLNLNYPTNPLEIDKAKQQQPREVQLKCLKNRQGNNYDCYFKYYSAHDYFEPYNTPSEKFDKLKARL